MACHTPAVNIPGECPVCRRNRWLSVSADSALATLARARRPGNAPHVRQADPGEFDDSPNLMKHTKVRKV